LANPLRFGIEIAFMKYDIFQIKTYKNLVSPPAIASFDINSVTSILPKMKLNDEQPDQL